jgi:hypothetical protein
MIWSLKIFLYSLMFLIVMCCNDHDENPLKHHDTKLPENCIQPPNTGMLIYDTSDKERIGGTQAHPVKECDCPSDPTNKIVFYNPVDNKMPTTGSHAGASTINMHCRKKEDVCICDEDDVCWKLENAYAQIVINNFCDPGILIKFRVVTRVGFGDGEHFSGDKEI